MRAIMKLENISKTFMDGDTPVKVLENISLEIKRGEFVAIVGPSGSGKSTLLSIIGALLTPSSGTVKINQEKISSYKPRQLKKVRSNKIGFIFQSANLIPYLTVKDQLLLVADIASKRNKQNKDKAVRLIDDLGLAHREKSHVHQLSGGEKQRVAIARAFMNDPEIILADEPTASLDSERGRQVVEMLLKEVKSKEKGAIMVTHDERMLDLCDRIYRMEDGQIREESMLSVENHPEPLHAKGGFPEKNKTL
ncbi:ABC transporter ATP-binding protein [Sediminibacillus albus]|uniref:Putative ABC transport system ATP-binding protein n=1 Tax=Sediminibacillus albus TaxID=407036 RepID=A0A1G8X4L8_9BACI|nr:ABC transporter ATP-binding protein [Sediminibacillus albus]SDJ85568.1 putative ABC transport system ATP-binding protein [Sediminibacillus albus]